MKKERGSALIISMLLISAVAGMAFGVARLFFIETAAAAKYETGAIAYYAAESGLEEGFLRYRYNQNAQVPFGTNFTLQNQNINRVNVTGSILNSPNIPTSTALSSLTSQYYDLRMGYLGTKGSPLYGRADSIDDFSASYATDDGYETLHIKKDESYKIDLSGFTFGTTTNSLNMGLRFSGLSDNSNGLQQCQAVAELKMTIYRSSAADVSEYKVILVPQANCVGVLNAASSGSTKLSNVGIMPAANQKVGVNPDNKAYYVWVNRLQDIVDVYNKGVLPTTANKVILSIKPLNYDADVSLFRPGCTSTAACNNASTVPGGPYTYIDSVGYYGGVSKKLEANIDRQSGTLYDLYDYVIYKAN